MTTIDFMWDGCGQVIAYMIHLIFSPILGATSKLIYSELPPDFEQYWKGIRGNARTDHRKAVKHGYSFRKIEKITKTVNNEIMEIWDSTDIRQARPINRSYFNLDCVEIPFLDEWPVKDYTIYPCPNHQLEFWAVEKDSKIAAYVEVLTCGNVIMVHSLLGHFDFLKHGIMKYLFVEMSREYIKRGIKYLLYGNENSLKGKLWFFLRDLRITNVFELESLPSELIKKLERDWKIVCYKPKTPHRGPLHLKDGELPPTAEIVAEGTVLKMSKIKDAME